MAALKIRFVTLFMHIGEVKRRIKGFVSDGSVKCGSGIMSELISLVTRSLITLWRIFSTIFF